MSDVVPKLVNEVDIMSERSYTMTRSILVYDELTNMNVVNSNVSS